MRLRKLRHLQDFEAPQQMDSSLDGRLISFRTVAAFFIGLVYLRVGLVVGIFW